MKPAVAFTPCAFTLSPNKWLYVFVLCLTLLLLEGKARPLDPLTALLLAVIVEDPTDQRLIPAAVDGDDHFNPAHPTAPKMAEAGRSLTQLCVGEPHPTNRRWQTPSPREPPVLS
ncbi:MAG: hypothetical protein V7629_00995 [Motiliproteus sp.]